jgi:hypothetical protein
MLPLITCPFMHNSNTAPSACFLVAQQVASIVRRVAGAMPSLTKQHSAFDRSPSRNSTRGVAWDPSTTGNSQGLTSHSQGLTSHAASPAGTPRGSIGAGGFGAASFGGGGGGESLSASPSKRGFSGVGSGTVGRQGAMPLTEAYLRERVSELEAEVQVLRRHGGAGGGGEGKHGNQQQQLDALRSELARYQAKCQELESDFLSLDVMARTDVGEADSEMRKAWYTAAAFKKR